MKMIDKIKTRTYLRWQRGEPDCKLIYAIEDDKVTVNSLISSLFADKEYKPTKNDKIYIYPGSTIPRFKVKTFCEKYKVSVVKFADKANVKIISNDMSKDLVTSGSYLSYYVRTELLEFLERYGNKNNKTVTDIIDLLKQQTSEIVNCDYYFNRALVDNNHGLAAINFKEKEYSDELTNYYEELNNLYFKDEDAYKEFLSVYNDPNVYTDHSLLRLLNTGGIMDAAQYENIKRLFESSDRSNNNLAMEAIANCDFERSAVYLLLLVHKYNNKMYESTNRNHVNFKSFLNFFDINSLRYSYSYEDLINALIKRKLLNQTNLDVLKPLLIEEAESKISCDYYTVDKLIWSDKITTALADNILDVHFNTELYDEPEEELQIKGLKINEEIFDVI